MATQVRTTSAGVAALQLCRFFFSPTKSSLGRVTQPSTAKGVWCLFPVLRFFSGGDSREPWTGAASARGAESEKRHHTSLDRVLPCRAPSPRVNRKTLVVAEGHDKLRLPYILIAAATPNGMLLGKRPHLRRFHPHVVGVAH